MAVVHGRNLQAAEAGGLNGNAGGAAGAGGGPQGGAVVGHHVDLPAEVALDANAPLSDLYAEVTGAYHNLHFPLLDCLTPLSFAFRVFISSSEGVSG
jgi:hypothetical protein